MEQFGDKYRIIQFVIILGAAVLLFQVASLQIFNPDYRQKAESTTVSKETLYPSRGLIFDRNGSALVVNSPRYELHVVYNKVSPDIDTTKLCRLLGITEEEFVRRLNKDWRKPMFSKSVPFPFIKNINARHFAMLQEYLHEFQGFFPVKRNVRGYPHSSACHALGYISEVDKDILADSAGSYTLGDYIGVAGLEKQYESDLRGKKGVRLTLKDNLGRTIGPFKEGELDIIPESGKDLIVSLDLDLQSYCEKLLANKKGSIVAIEPSSGEILAYVSAPYYDPNLMSSSLEREDQLESLLLDTLNPFFDRCIMAKYPPASIFKPVMALIAMEEGVANTQTSIYCPGFYKFENYTYGCRQHPYPYNMKVALQYSCNSYFFQIFRNTIEHYGYKNHDKGLDIMVDYLSDFGLGAELGIDHPNESTGFVPTSQFYDALYPEYEWKSTYIMSIGIGQGELQLTTLQMANLAAAIANRGYYITPHFLKGYMDVNKSVNEALLEKHEINIDTSFYPTIVEGMERTVRAGTAWRAYNRDVVLCGKTGTSQNPAGEDHSVFFGFAPMNDPQIAVAVYIENAGSGGAVAAPVGSLVVEKYLQDSIHRTYLEKQMLEVDLINKNRS
ncbi:MAG: penicillin-binding protein 2 [Saprospiraceae bacterium]|nr:penicillin-binding protein 2 [Saprospiraceae bacterium]